MKSISLSIQWWSMKLKEKNQLKRKKKTQVNRVDPSNLRYPINLITSKL